MIRSGHRFYLAGRQLQLRLHLLFALLPKMSKLSNQLT